MAFKVIIGRARDERLRYKGKGLIKIGKQYVQMGQVSSLTNNVYLDIATTHVMLITGKRGSGKCVAGDTLITLDDGSVVPIQYLENSTNNVMGLNEELKVTPVKKEGFYKRVVSTILKIKLRSGKEIKLTPEHPLLTIKGWIPAEELNVGSRIATPRIIKSFGKEKMDLNKIKLLAYLIAEGHIKKSTVSFSNYDPDIVIDFKRAINNFSENLKVRIIKKGCYSVTTKYGRGYKTGHPIKQWLKEIGLYGKLSKDKFIPKEIFQLEKPQTALFLNRLFSCDGSIYNNQSRNGWEISYSSTSKVLINQVHHLLLRFGILSKIRDKKIKCSGKLFKSYEIIIGSDNILRFIKEIGFFHPDKAIKSIACSYDMYQIKTNPNVDTIPKEIWALYRPTASWTKIGRAFGYAHPKAMRERLRYAPARATLLQIARTDNNRAIQLLAESDIFWDEVVLIENLDGEFEVYDISVPEHHNFIANDIIIHNSTTLSVIAEEISRLDEEIKKRLSVIMFDTLGVFWTMKYPNYRQQRLLDKWEITPEATKMEIFVPTGHYQNFLDKGMLVDKKFSLRVSDIKANDWCTIFNLDLLSSQGIFIQNIVRVISSKLRLYGLKDIIAEIEGSKTDEKVKQSVLNLFLIALTWGLFRKKGTKLKSLTHPGRISVIDLSPYTYISSSFSIKALVIALISRKLLAKRMKVRRFEELQDIQSSFLINKKQELPLVWLLIDELHEFLPKDSKTIATDPLIQIIREGRQPGITLVGATQQPGEIHKDMLTQSDVVIAHRLTAEQDIKALSSMMQTYLLSNIETSMRNLPKYKGAALILDDNSERIYTTKIKPKRSWHGGEAPSAVKIEKEIQF